MARRRGPGGRGASPRVRALLSCLLVLVAAQALFAGLATLAAALPRGPIEANLAASADDPLLTGYFDYTGSLMGSRECHDNNRYIAEIASQDALGGPLEAAAVNDIDDFDYTGEHKHWQYFRYWHGWSLLTNAVLELGGIRLVSLAVLALEAAGAAALLLALRRECGWAAAALFVAALSLSTGLAWSFLSDLTLGTSFSALLAGCTCVLSVRRRRGGAAALAAVVATGCTWGFLDFCTVPKSRLMHCPSRSPPTRLSKSFRKDLSLK